MVVPAAAKLRVDALEFDPFAPAIMLTVTSTQLQAACSACHQLATRVHSRYCRSIADLPWADIPVRFQLHVRKFFCANTACSQRIFTERLPTLVAPSARRTVRLLERQRHVALALGGTAGAALSRHLASPASRNTFLQLARTTPRPPQPVPHVLGVDDWSQRKGQSYRTILVDIERHRPIALLPDREAATLATWLAAHPGVEIICRDRAGAYAEGARTGAPTAIQVADRFHLLHNLYDVLRRVLEEHTPVLASLNDDQASERVNLETPPVMAASSALSGEPLLSIPPAVPSPRAQEQAQQVRAQRLARYEQVCHLHRQGWTITAIAQKVGLERNTVHRFVMAPAFPERQRRPPRGSVLDPFKPYIVQRWNGGCHTGMTIWRELEQQGFPGKRATVFRYVSQLRAAHGLPPKKRRLMTTGQLVERRPPSTTPRSLAWLVLRRREQLDAGEQQRISQLRHLHPQIDEAVGLTEKFAGLVRERQGGELDDWLERAARSSLAPFRGFARSLRQDHAAVTAGLSLAWSSGPVEGQINRLKVIKRAMFGRAKLDLLEQRVLYAA
ncbi:MAG: ISL3 family transposase [Herpetosiphonaceae bacterium]|nr:ISL3 family transposase [Herpetosiphonaceae bacterium]